MGNTVSIKERRVCVKPLRSSLETIQKLISFTTTKSCRGFADIVGFLSIFCLVLQKLLKPRYDLTRQSRWFMWGEEQQNAFEEIKLDCKTTFQCNQH